MNNIESYKIKVDDVLSIIYDVVESTYGPLGGSILYSELGEPRMTKDGITAAENIPLVGMDRLIADYIIKASRTLDNRLGDGSSTNLLLTINIYRELVKLDESLDTPTLDRITEACINELLTNIQKDTIPCNDVILNKIALTSANNNSTIATEVFKAFKEYQSDENILLKQGFMGYDYFKPLKGFVLENVEYPIDYLDNKKEITLENPIVVIYQNTLNTLNDITEFISKAKQDIVILCKDYTTNCRLESIKTINTVGLRNVYLIKIPKHYHSRHRVFSDLSIFTNIDILKTTKEVNVSNIYTINSFYFNNQGIISISNNSNEKLEKHTEDLKQDSHLNNPWEYKTLKERIARLSSKVGIIYIDYINDTDYQDKVLKYTDVIMACRSGIKGVIAGSNTTLLRIGYALSNTDLQLKDVFYNAIKTTYYSLYNKNIEDTIIKEIAENKDIYLDITFDRLNIQENLMYDPAIILEEIIKNATKVALNLYNTKHILYDNH